MSEAYAAIATVAGVNEADVAEALRAGSRLERIGMVENLISEHNITDLADLMKVSEQLPPVLMRRSEGPSDLMAVFTRSARHSELSPSDFHYVSEDHRVLTALLSHAVARKEPGVNVLLYGPPGTGKTALAEHIAQQLQRPLMAGLGHHEQVRRRDRAGGAAARRGRQLPAQPTPGRAQLRDQRSQRDAAGHGAFRRCLHLRELEALAPGDFASVKRQIDVLGEAFEPDEFLSQLEAEHRVKPDVRQQRHIGFMHWSFSARWVVGGLKSGRPEADRPE